MSFLEYLKIALPQIWVGLLITFRVSFVCLLIGMALGFPVALARVYGPKWLRWLVTGYVEIFRGTPVLVQLFLIYYGLPQFGITFSPFIRLSGDRFEQRRISVRILSRASAQQRTNDGCSVVSMTPYRR
jgi:His/Glu/Gln/Arg/opine family amino acid ABC transporter permease subunit